MSLKVILKGGSLEVRTVKNPFVFIGIIALAAALVLAVVSEATKARVKENKDLDRMKNILTARFLEEYNLYESKLSDETQVKELYKEHIIQQLYSLEGDLVDDETLNFSDLVWKENKKDGSLYYYFKADLDKQYLPFFKVKDGGYIIPISGKGLWSTLKGFIYIIQNGGNSGNLKNGEYTVKGISFYEHKETPGLGGEIDKIEIKKRYIGKSIDLNKNIAPIMTKAPKESNSYELQYISGATITSDGLNEFIKRDLNRYKIILEKVE